MYKTIFWHQSTIAADNVILDPNWTSDYYDLNCIADKTVKYPKLRVQLLKLVNDPEGSSQKIIIL